MFPLPSKTLISGLFDFLIAISECEPNGIQMRARRGIGVGEAAGSRASRERYYSVSKK